MGDESTAVGILLVALLGLLVLTHGAVQQTLPAGGPASEEYVVDYARVTADADGVGHDYEYDAGPPLSVRYELSDDVISETDNATLTVTVSNPTEKRLRGRLEVLAHTTYWLRGPLTSVRFDLAPGATLERTLTLPGEPLVADRGTDPRTVSFGAEAQLFTESYRVVDTERRSRRGEGMTLRVRKPFFHRFGVYWVGFLGLVGFGIGYRAWTGRERGPRRVARTLRRYAARSRRSVPDAERDSG
jgi:hypothetical protein